jgi:hypothetical protein
MISEILFNCQKLSNHRVTRALKKRISLQYFQGDEVTDNDVRTYVVLEYVSLILKQMGFTDTTCPEMTIWTSNPEVKHKLMEYAANGGKLPLNIFLKKTKKGGK